jgi:hypothetical protein
MTYKKIGENRDHCREYYENEKGEKFATVYNRDNKKVLHTITEEGEPIRPIYETEEKSLFERVKEDDKEAIKDWEDRAEKGEVIRII